MPSRKLRKASATSFELRGGGDWLLWFFIRRLKPTAFARVLRTLGGLKDSQSPVLDDDRAIGAKGFQGKLKIFVR